MRVWWRGPPDNRVDVVTAAGETGTHRDPAGSWTWEYETRDRHPQRGRPARSARAAGPAAERPGPPAAVGGHRRGAVAGSAPAGSPGATALGAAADPGRRRVLGQPGGRLGGRRQRAAAAGRGVREGRRTARAGHPLPRPRSRRPRRRGDPLPPPPAARVREGRQAEVVLEAGRRIRPVALPAELAGLARRELTGVPAGIGLYGRGVTLLAVAPVPERLATGLRRALAQSPDAVVDELGARIAAGPVGADGRRAAGPRPLRAHRHRHPRRAGRRGRASCPTWWARR